MTDASAPLLQAIERHNAGELAAARTLYREILARTPEHAQTLFRAGLLELQDGQAEVAEALLRRAHHGAPEQLRYALGFGHALSQLQRWSEAAEVYRRAVQAHPDAGDGYHALGLALQALGDHAGAVRACSDGLARDPDQVESYNRLGICHRALGQWPQAEQVLRQAVHRWPGHAAAWSNLGTLLDETDRPQEAVEALRRAVALEPGAAVHAVNLGVALCRQHRHAEAVDALRGAMQHTQDQAELRFNLGNALYGIGRVRDAAEQYRIAAGQRLDHLDALNNLGNAYRQLGEIEQSMAAYEAAQRIQPDSAVVLNNLSCLLLALGRVDEAEAVLRRGLDRVPNHATLYNNLGNALKAGGELDAALACYRKAVTLDPANPVAHSNLAYTLSFQCEHGRPILDECRRWSRRHAPAAARGAAAAAARDPLPRRLRIGYVSADFRDHCQSLFTIPLLAHHDRTAVQVYCYSSVERVDRLTRRIRGLVDVWRDVAALDDAALCDLIREDRIDVLVDLTMHMANGRPKVFAAKPAAVQIAWLAYPGTTGLDAMDFRISDPRLDPPDKPMPYSERTIRLPDTFWCYDPLSDDVDVGPLPALTRGQLTLGCLNNPCKLTDHTLALWAAVMRELTHARLVLMVPHGRHRLRLQRRMQAHGIAPDRLEFLAYRPRAEYLRSYHDIDLGLDTFPYNGHTTSLDSLWMGVPVVTRVGQTCVGRGGLSQLHNLNLLELAADSDAGFVDAAVALGRDLPRLAGLRASLRAQMAASALMDGPRFARHIEAAYRHAFEDVVAVRAA